MELLTEKCYSKFRKWYESNNNVIPLDGGWNDICFQTLPLPFQWGVYQDFFESNKIWILKHDQNSYNIDWIKPSYYSPKYVEGRAEAIKAANEIYNNNN